MTHTILRQYVHVDLRGSESDGFALQNRLPELCSQWLNPAIERALDRYVPGNEYFSIERLEIDAGPVALDRFDADFPEAVLRALEKALAEEIPAGEARSAPGDSAAGDPPASGRFKTERQVALEAFLHFLETGRLPWSFRLPAGVALEQNLLDFLRKDSGSSPLADLAGLSRPLRAPEVRRRLVRQFSLSFLDVLLKTLSEAAQISVRHIREASGASAALTTGTYAQSPFEKQLWETAFAQVAVAGATDAPALAALTIAAMPETAPVVLPRLKEILRPALPAFIGTLQEQAGADFRVTIAHLKVVFGAEMPELPDVLTRSHSPKPAPSPAGVPVGDPVPDTAGGGEKDDNRLQHLRQSVPDEGIFVNNAGLVILHPFLQMFFEGLGIARDGALLQPDRALHLLHFLGTGQTPAPEYELTLPKILCNIPLETPVEADIALTDKEKEESEALLAAAIRWWEALGNTSPDALRGTFLCRPGKLSVRGDGDWLLQVERQPFDVLLDRLPWGISALRLPWMERMLWVEWG